MVRIKMLWTSIMRYFQSATGLEFIHESNPNLLPLQQIPYELTMRVRHTSRSHSGRHFTDLKG
jgi:hypothetical protein